MQEYRKYVSLNQECEAVVYIKELAYQKIIDTIKRQNKETGGIIIGYYSTSLREVYINEFGEAPEDSQSGFSFFIRGVKGLGDYLKRKWKLCNEYYLGEWHFHPACVPEPSRTDLKQLEIIAVDDRYNCKEPILIIFYKNRDSIFEVTIRVLLKSIIYDFSELRS